jgi:hypothetical protein
MCLYELATCSNHIYFDHIYFKSHCYRVCDVLILPRACSPCCFPFNTLLPKSEKHYHGKCHPGEGNLLLPPPYNNWTPSHTEKKGSTNILDWDIWWRNEWIACMQGWIQWGERQQRRRGIKWTLKEWLEEMKVIEDVIKAGEEWWPDIDEKEDLALECTKRWGRRQVRRLFGFESEKAVTMM